MNPVSDILPCLPDPKPTEALFQGPITKPMIDADADAWEARAFLGISVTPSGNLSWTIPLATILLNELDETWSPDGTSRLISREP
jgi:hypothetical protein